VMMIGGLVHTNIQTQQLSADTHVPPPQCTDEPALVLAVAQARHAHKRLQDASVGNNATVVVADMFTYDIYTPLLETDQDLSTVCKGCCPDKQFTGSCTGQARTQTAANCIGNRPRAVHCLHRGLERSLQVWPPAGVCCRLRRNGKRMAKFGPQHPPNCKCHPRTAPKRLAGPCCGEIRLEPISNTGFG
jgi:hypothetical protein